ncbi:putative ABC transport system permease protein [Micromonospora rhizosphaerae]|uniref:Putative ABC transport system permease protein n=1 Tax=Micromonospora rhizosphaerae TaxID=568872 RepID=A0A1C6SMQ8_9ACTN|nr:ABC transporter permease [Micromonospora rhizosphaerae]SCL30794.1 putative ABC transport system permease protein [Micromonospora rhizosphaerae]
MNTTTVPIGPALVAALLGLTVAAAVVLRLTGLGRARAILTAAARATIQLAAVSLVIVAVLRAWWSTLAFVLIMYAVATVTARRRIGAPCPTWITSAAIALGVAPSLAVLLASRALPATQVVVLPTAGILIGGAMTATSLAGRRTLDELRTRHGEYEAGLALGLLPRDAALEICRPAAGQALIPALDQTRTVGLVTLPGAFVGVLLGGAGPIQAGATQLLILLTLLAVEAVAIALTVELIVRSGATTAG